MSLTMKKISLIKSILIVLAITSSMRKVSSNTLHTASACFSKTFQASNFNASDDNDVPLRDCGNQCGEDDFLISQLGDISLLTVADGVGSWSNYGVNPKVFTNELLKSINLVFQSLSKKLCAEHDKKKRSFLLNIITWAYTHVQTTKQFIRLGSCTVCTLSLNLETLHLNSYVLGDSGFMIIRNGKIIYRSTDLVHQFNQPFQLAFVNEHSSLPSHGYTRPFKLRTNDIIVIGSDGLFDNLFDEAILYYVNEETRHLTPRIQKGYTEAARRIAKKLTILAKRLGETKLGEIVSPFSEEANNLKILDFTLYTGKNDDTTVVVAIIS